MEIRHLLQNAGLTFYSLSFVLVTPFIAVIFKHCHLFDMTAARQETQWPVYDLIDGHFPDGFMWGVATASYQIEGSPRSDGKTDSIWDVFCRRAGAIKNGTSGDVACDSYNQWETDISCLQQLGVQHYRFSVSWARVVPKPFEVNEAGLKYYKDLLKGLHAANIIPVVTLYHWDLPQYIEDDGGWLNDAVVKHFEFFARTLFEHLGGQVQWWITLNEPYIIARYGYGIGKFAPGVKQPGTGEYLAAHNLLKAHAAAYRLYEQEFKTTQNGQMGITLNTNWNEPRRSDKAAVAAADRAMHFDLGWFAEPIFGSGDYPAVMRAEIDRLSRPNDSRLPRFTEQEKQLLKGSADFFGLNAYTTRYVDESTTAWQGPDHDNDMQVSLTIDPDWPRGESEWLYVVPWGIQKLLKWVKNNYDDPKIFITENGVSDSGTLNDNLRIYYFKNYLNFVLRAIIEDKCNVIGYTAWTLMDNFEWASGYTERFGLFKVDFDDEERPRRAKKSAEYFGELVRANGFANVATRPLRERLTGAQKTVILVAGLAMLGVLLLRMRFNRYLYL